MQGLDEFEGIALSAVGGESVAGGDFFPQAVDKLVYGMIGDTGGVFDVRVNDSTDLVFGDKLAKMGFKQFQEAGFGGGKYGIRIGKQIIFQQ